MRWSRSWTIGSLLALSVVAAIPIEAALLAVDTPDDAVDTAVGDGVCATAAGRCSLRAAVQEANARPGPDEIALPAGHYTLEGPGTSSAGAVLAPEDDLVIRGSGAATRIDAGGRGGIFDVAAEGARLALRGLRIEGGSSTAVRCGGGARCEFGGVRLTDNAGDAVVDCRAARSCRFDGVLIDDNPAGIGIACGDCTIRDSRIEGNAGAGIEVGGAAVSLGGSTVAGNGGAGVRGSKQSRSLEVVDSTVRENRAGGIDVGGRLSVLRSAIVGNERSDDCGGGIRLQGGRISGSTLIASTVSGNRAPRGGGICLLWLGGNVNPFLSILSSTITANRADAAGGLLVVGELQHIGPPGPGFVLEKSILAGNEAALVPDCAAGALRRTGARSAESLGWNLVGIAEGCLMSPAEGDLLGSVAEPIDPRLEVLADDGGPTPTHAPRGDSPALDRIPADACASSPILVPVYAQHRVRIAPETRFDRTGIRAAEDTRWIVFSGWFEFSRPIGSREALLSVGDAAVGEFLRISREDDGRLGIEIRSAAGEGLLSATSHQVISSDEMHSLVLGYNTGIQALDAFLDDEELTFDARYGSDAPIPYASLDGATWSLFARYDGSGEGFVGRVGDVWMDDDFLSVDSGAQRYDFYDLNNRPRDLGVDARERTKRGVHPPLLYLGHTMRAEDWNAGENRGRGGSFRVRGGVRDAPDAPVRPAKIVDQRGTSRPQGGGCEIGAVERTPGDAGRPLRSEH